MQNGTGDYSDYHDILSDYSTLIFSATGSLCFLLYKKISSMLNFSNNIAEISTEIASDSEHNNLHAAHTNLANLINMHKAYISKNELAALNELMGEIGVLLKFIADGHITRNDKAEITKKYFNVDAESGLLQPKGQYTWLAYVINKYTNANAIVASPQHDDSDREELLIKTADTLTDICNYLVALVNNKNPINFSYIFKNGREVPSCEPFIIEYLKGKKAATCQSGSRSIRSVSPVPFTARSMDEQVTQVQSVDALDLENGQGFLTPVGSANDLKSAAAAENRMRHQPLQRQSVFPSALDLTSASASAKVSPGR